MSTEAVQPTERPEIKHDDPKFGGRLVPFYRALVDEVVAASQAASEAKQPLPTEYSLSVPKDKHERDAFVIALLDELDRSLASQTKHPMTSEDIRSVRHWAAQIVPFAAVESDSFPALMRLRVAVNERLLKAGLVEALACIMRAQLRRGEAISAAQALSRDVLAEKGTVKVIDLDPGTWSDIIGQRIVTQDDRSNAPAVVQANQALYEKLFATSGDEAQLVLQRIVDVFNKKVDPFAKLLFPRDPEYIRVQWFNAMLKNLDRLNQRDDVDDLRAALEYIADRLEAAKDVGSFMGVINTIANLQVIASDTPIGDSVDNT